MKKRINGIVLVLLVLAVFLLESGRLPLPWLTSDRAAVTTGALPESFAGKLEVVFLDVGQGNAVLLRSGEHAMLVDGGPADSSARVVQALKRRQIRRLDYVIATHYDADHISGLVGVLHVFPVETAMNPAYETDSRIYRSYCEMRDENGCRTVVPKLGEQYALGDASFTVVAPAKDSYEEENDRSIGIRVVCGETSFLLLGDAGWRSEADMTQTGELLRSDVYLCSHHGSAASSGETLLSAVRPQAAVISVGADNTYGHPAEETMERLRDWRVLLFRTDRQGDITAVSDLKREACMCHVSQNLGPIYDGWHTPMELFRGIQGRCGRGEAFMRHDGAVKSLL